MQIKHYKEWYLLTIGRDRSPEQCCLIQSNFIYAWNIALHRNMTECLLIVITQCYAKIWQPNTQIQIPSCLSPVHHIMSMWLLLWLSEWIQFHDRTLYLLYTFLCVFLNTYFSRYKLILKNLEELHFFYLNIFR